MDRRLEGVAKAVWGGYCRLQMPLKLALCVWGTVAGRWLGAGGRWYPPPPSNASLQSHLYTSSSVTVYAPKVLELGHMQHKMLGAVCVMLWYFGSAILGMGLVDRLGRRKLLLRALFVMACTMLLMGPVFQMIKGKLLPNMFGFVLLLSFVAGVALCSGLYYTAGGGGGSEKGEILMAKFGTTKVYQTLRRHFTESSHFVCAGFSASGMHSLLEITATTRKPSGTNSNHPEAKFAVYACSCITIWGFCTKFCS